MVGAALPQAVLPHGGRGATRAPPFASGAGRDERPDDAVRHSLSGHRPGARRSRPGRDPLVRARLHRRDLPRLVVRQVAGPERGDLGALRPAHEAGGHRRLRRVVRGRHHPRRPDRLRALLRPAAVHGEPARDLRPLARGHVLPRRLPRHGAGDGGLRPPAEDSGLVADRRDRALGHLRPVPRPSRQLHQRGAVRPGDRRALGDRVPQRRAGAASSEPALRGAARGAGAVPGPSRPDQPHGQAAPARLRLGRLRRRLRRRADDRRVLPRARHPDRLPRRRPHHGDAAVDPDDRRRHRPHGLGGRRKPAGSAAA